MIFYASIKNNQLNLSNPEYLQQFLKKINNCDCVTVEIKKKRNTRSNQQNSLYWGVILAEISNETGHTANELHEIFKHKFLPKKFVVIKGKEYETTPTTTKEDTKEFTDFIENIIRWSSQELGIIWNL